jgi:uncharacterized protein YegP (UPF0339 family)
MATATKKHKVSTPEPMEFLVFQDNGGEYHWRLAAGDRAILGQSGSFATYEDAEQGARRVRDGAASARLGGSAVKAGATAAKR